MKIRSLWLTALCAVVGLVSTVSAAPSDVRYAPANADLIIRINGRAIHGNRIFAKFKESADYQAWAKKAQDELTKVGLVLDDMIKSDVYVFADVDTFNPNRPAMHFLFRTSKPYSSLLLGLLDKKAAEPGSKKTTVKRIVVGGKEARVVADESVSMGVVAIAGDLLQISLNSPELTELVKGSATELTSIIDSDAMISIAYKISEASANALLAKCPEEFRPFITGLTAASINLIDGGESIRIKGELAYADQQTADGIRQMLQGLLEVLRQSSAQDNPELAEVLKKITISGRGNMVVISFDCPNEEIIKLMKF